MRPPRHFWLSIIELMHLIRNPLNVWTNPDSSLKGLTVLCTRLQGFPWILKKLPICIALPKLWNLQLQDDVHSPTQVSRVDHQWQRYRRTVHMEILGQNSELAPWIQSIWLANWGLGSSLEQDCSYSKSWLLISPMFTKPINLPECLLYTKLWPHQKLDKHVFWNLQWILFGAVDQPRNYIQFDKMGIIPQRAIRCEGNDVWWPHCFISRGWS